MTKPAFDVKVSPVGRAAYAWLNKPDTQFSDEGKYKVTLVLQKGDEEVEQFVDELLQLSVDNEAEADTGFGLCCVKDGDGYRNTRGKLITKEEFSGTYLLSFSSKYKPNLVDTKRKPLPDGITVFSGDTIRVAFRPSLWRQTPKGPAQMTLRPLGVMLVERTSGATDTNTSLFGDVDDKGYEVPEATTESDGDF